MRQTTLSVTLEVDPGSCERLSTLIDELRDQEESAPHGIPERYERMNASVPALHFMSISVFPGFHYDPLLVIEANFDGAQGVFWGQLEAAIGEQLRPMLRCCKRPQDQDGRLYDAVAAPGSRAPIAPYLEARAVRPSVFHHGNRGMSRDRILQEARLFDAIRTELADNNAGGASAYRGVPAQQIHERMRAALLPGQPWLAEAAPARISPGERASDIARLLGFVLAAILILSLPGLIVAPVASTWRFAALFALLSLLVWTPLLAMHKPLPGAAAPRPSGGLAFTSMTPRTRVVFIVAILLLLAIYFAAATALVAAAWALVADPGYREAIEPAARTVALGLAVILPFSVPALLLWLRWLERRDSSQDGPPTNQRLIREMAHREDRIPQNHMGSIVLVKPGVLRSALFRAGHLGLGLVLRATATDGYLGSMRTVHFAHWAFINNGHRLLFFSNFDNSWESYLDDFIEKAHEGLTLAWGSCVGFPPTRFLVKDGASHGRKFKNWVRHSMAVSRFWFSAYPNYTVDQIERNARIADGLRKKRLSPQEAEQWAWDL